MRIDRIGRAEARRIRLFLVRNDAEVTVCLSAALSIFVILPVSVSREV
jgi:hypothetical protein